MDWKYLLTDLEGRINRKPYWLAAITLVVIGIALQLIGYRLAGEPLAIILGLVMVYPSFALNVKRAHDRNRPTWLVVIFFALLIVVNIIQLLGMGQTPDGPTPLYLAIAVPWFILALYLFVELACLRGTVGPNQYGPDPLAGRG